MSYAKSWKNRAKINAPTITKMIPVRFANRFLAGKTRQQQIAKSKTETDSKYQFGVNPKIAPMIKVDWIEKGNNRSVNAKRKEGDESTDE